jgi:predicted oxidoreductase (fatty acid repression mutant protein)
VVAKDTKERLDSLLEYTRKNIYGIFEEGTDRQLILTYLLKAMKGAKNEQHIWEIMDNDLLSVIPQKKYQDKKEKC